MDELTRGMSYQSQKASDQYFDPEVSYDEQRVWKFELFIKLTSVFIPDHSLLI